MDSKIEKNINEMKNGTYGEKMNQKSVGYKKGAVVGLVVGVLAGMYFKKNLIMFGLIGVVGGGYVGYKIAEATETQNGFKNLGSKN